MVDFDLIPSIEKVELMKAIAAPVREYFHEPVNVEEFQVWLDNKNL